MSRRLFACFRGKKPSSSTSKPNSGNNSSAAVSADVPAGDGPVLVQLFSSQGCKTSPAAEMLMSRLGRGDFDAQIRGGGEEGGSGSPAMVLVFHVDYWDYKGWKDPYGSSQWTVRQKGYVEALNLDTMFTPQIVVQGRTQLNENEEETLLKSISEAPRFPSPAFKASFQRPTSETLQVSLTGALRMKVDGNGLDIMVALYETGLVTDCERGENEGRMLSNDYVVRKMEKMCTVKDVTAKKSVSGTAHFTLWDGFNSSKCGVAVFVQNSSLHIFGTMSQLKNRISGGAAASAAKGAKPLDNVILHPSLKKRIEHLARDTSNAKSHQAPFRNMMFYGPPGTGKTIVAREIARKSGLDYAMMTGGDVAPLGSQAVTKIHQIFDWAKKSDKGLLLFIDEADAFLCERNSVYMSEAQRSALNALLFRSGDQSRDIVLVLATNRPGDLDGAVTDRIDEVIEFPLPGEEERFKLLNLYLNNYLKKNEDNIHTRPKWSHLFKKLSQEIRVEDDLTDKVISEAASKTKGFSGCEIAKLVAGVQAGVYGRKDCVLDSQLFKEIVEYKVEEHHQRIRLASEGCQLILFS